MPVAVSASILAAFLLLLAGSPAQGAVYKCATDKGVVYQDAACPPGKELRNLDEDPATLSIIPGTPVPAAPRAAMGKKPPRPRADATKLKSGNAAERRFIRAGMSEAEVVMRIGRPDVDSKGRGKTGRRWAYLPADGDLNTLTTVTIASGTVVDVERRVAR